MQLNKPKHLPYLISTVVHIILIGLFFLVKMNEDAHSEEYFLVGFSSGFGLGSGSPGEEGGVSGNQSSLEKADEKKNEPKDAELPDTRNTDDERILNNADEKKIKDLKANSKVKPLTKNDLKDSEFGTGSGNTKGNGTGIGGDGNGGFGFELDFGGRGKRRIYSYFLPPYPEGVSKEIDLRLRFTILPDGTVSKIIPLIKADARLESTAINSLRQWRFEPIPPNMKQLEQTVVITFPYRLQ